MTLTARAAIADLAERLRAAGIDDARLDARLLVAEAAGLEPARLVTDSGRMLDDGQRARLESLAARRLAREPISHILGRRGFWTLELEVTADTLAPRPDTETLVEAVLEALPDRAHPWRILDLGTGTGCILLALLSEFPNATGLGVDASRAALDVARRNAAACGLTSRAQFRQGDWGSGIDQCFDAIVSNPPYIPDNDIPDLEPEVARFEPRSALAGGADGLDCYRRLAFEVGGLLAPGGIVAFEVGAGQAGAVTGLLNSAGFGNVASRRDLGGIERCVTARR